MINLYELFYYLENQPSESFESETLEFKNYKDENALFNAKDLSDEICAFANKKGGRIIIGVKDDSDIKNLNYIEQLNGFEIIDLDIAKERLNGRLKPKIDITLEYFQFEKKNYLIINVPNINHTIVSTSSGKVYIREGKSSVPAEPYQIQELVTNLQSYDWSNQEINLENPLDVLNDLSVKEAKEDFCIRRKIQIDSLTDEAFLESIGGTRNGVLNYSGLLFLGKVSEIEKYLGNYEFRFSWRTSSGQLKINDVWNDCIWNNIKRAKDHFDICNKVGKITYNEQEYELTPLDPQAFHEAFLNSIVHRDYSIDGMISINYKEDELIISNPGKFYGGVTEENISYHEPRHRNKSLAKLLMAFQLVDRAGMGVLRISLNSLKYGRDFPIWTENLSNIEVKMPAEYIKIPVFILTQKYIDDCSITDLYLINKLCDVGYIDILEAEKDLKKKYKDPWIEISKSLNRSEMMKYIELKGNNNGIYITTTLVGDIWLNVSKPFRQAANSDKHVSLFLYLKKHKNATNEEIKTLLSFSRASVTFNFLSKLKYVKNVGKSRSSRWSLK